MTKQKVIFSLKHRVYHKKQATLAASARDFANAQYDKHIPVILNEVKKSYAERRTVEMFNIEYASLDPSTSSG